MSVYLYGQLYDMEYITGIAKDYNMYMIEDCAQPYGVTYRGQSGGSFGDVGAIITNNEK